MASRKPSLDLERELTCSICTELLHQPLTLLDCLHTFCGACLKEWFGFQAATAETSPTPPAAGAVFTCPSCRSAVRDTRRNATVVTLLDMFVAAQPAKARSAADKEEMAQKYQPGDQVLPRLRLREPTAGERRAEEEDRRLLEGVREMSLREATAGSSQPPPRSPRRTQSRSVDDRARAGRNRSSDGHSRHTGEGSRRRRADEGGRRSSDLLPDDRERRRRDWGEAWPRQVEHQSSLRSLIGSADMGARDIEREIEELARQIQEEGLLDGLDLDNIDLTRDDELSRRVTEAYRRRQRERSRQEPARRSNIGAGRPADVPAADARRRAAEGGGRAGSRSRAASRPASGNGAPEDRSRPPLANPSSLEVRDPARRTRRRTASGGRSATTPLLSSGVEARPAARSQTDLASRSQPSDPPTPSRQSFGERRSSSTPLVLPPPPPPAELPAPSAGSNASFADRAPQWNPTAGEAAAGSHREPASTPPRAHRPSELAAVHSAVSSPVGSPMCPPSQPRPRSQLYPEPCISCSRCGKAHIEYELHYNCATCAGGQWNMCLDCYRAGKGCLYWFGFGHGAWSRWEKAQAQDESLARPHMLTASRYLRPPSTPGGADGRRTLTASDPRTRLETGTFCARCLAWTNACFWRCDVCNDGDWGYCNDCVNQGNSCTHMLLPLSHEPPAAAPGRPRSPRWPGRPATATIFSGPQASSMGPFKPLTFRTRCNVCQNPMAPSQVRYHCFSCTGAPAGDGPAGDYDICAPCYGGLVGQGRISAENGHSGWRRCLAGHRMVVIGFVDGKVGQWRYVERDLVGGHGLWSEAVDGERQGGQGGLERWRWRHGDEAWQRLVTTDVSATAPPASPGSTQGFPPDGGMGMRGPAPWAWYPRAAADDELLFPRGAEVREIEDINGHWLSGSYMGARGLFPAGYVRLPDG